MELPLTKQPAESGSPGRLLIYSQPKAGKTTLVAGLENCLLIDTEKGARYVEAAKVSVSDWKELAELCKIIKEQGKPYKYIAIDTVTELESMCQALALAIYNGTPMGKSYKGNILHLANGGGYLYLREAFDQIIRMVQDCCERVILLGHIKDKLIEKKGKEVSSKDVDLTGKIKSMTCAKADAIGYLFREGNKVFINFSSDGVEEIVCGARPAHLRNQTILVSEEIEPGKVITYWDKIFID